MELLRAQREGREEEFKSQEREKQRACAAALLDAEMDDYFSARPKKTSTQNTTANNNGAEPHPATIRPDEEDVLDTTADVSEAVKHLTDADESEPQPPISEPEKSMRKPLDSLEDPQTHGEPAQ